MPPTAIINSSPRPMLANPVVSQSVFRVDSMDAYPVRSGDIKQRIVQGHVIAFTHRHFENGAVTRRPDLGFHFHGFHDHDDVTLLYFLPWLYLDLENIAGQG